MVRSPLSAHLQVDLEKNEVASSHIVVNQMIQGIHEPGDAAKAPRERKCVMRVRRRLPKGPRPVQVSLSVFKPVCPLVFRTL